jgi:hypothetical protein
VKLQVILSNSLFYTEAKELSVSLKMDKIEYRAALDWKNTEHKCTT